MSTPPLHAPWRMEYIRSLEKPDGEACFLCLAAAASGADEMKRRLVLWTTDHTVVVMNKYPYTNGHLLVAPRAHVADLESLPIEALNDLTQQTVKALKLLKCTCSPARLQCRHQPRPTRRRGIARPSAPARRPPLERRREFHERGGGGADRAAGAGATVWGTGCGNAKKCGTLNAECGMKNAFLTPHSAFRVPHFFPHCLPPHILAPMDVEIRKQLVPGAKIRVTQQIASRLKTMVTVVRGTVVEYEQKQTGSWYAHSKDDKLWLDRLTLRKADGEISTLNLDDYSVVELDDETATSPV